MKTFVCKYSDLESLEDFITANTLVDGENLLIQIFSGTSDRDLLKALLDRLFGVFKKSIIIGASTDGEIYHSEVTSHKIIVSFSLFEKTTLKSSVLKSDKITSSQKIGNELLNELLIKNDLKGLLTFTSGSTLNAQEYLSAFQREKDDFFIAGGIGGDNGSFNGNFIICGNEIIEAGAVVVGFYSQTLYALSRYAFNWQPLGKELRVTKSVGNRVYEIDNIKAVDIYEKYLGGDIAQNLPKTGIEFPLLFNDDGVVVARAVLGKMDDGSLIFGGNLEEGTLVRFGYGNVDMILGHIQSTYEDVCSFEPETLFVYSCMARRRLLDTKANIEIESLSKITDVCGFYTYGEFFNTSKNPLFLNETMTILALRECESKSVCRTEPMKTILEEETGNLNAIKALTHLVSVATQESEELFIDNRKKDEIMFHQAKLASMGEMISNIAHQWRQPLTALTMTIQSVQLAYELGYLDKEFLDKQVEIALRTAQYMSQTIEDCGNFFKPREDKKVFELNSLMMQIEHLVYPLIKNENIKIEFKHCDCEDIHIDGYENGFTQAIINIINNSRDAFIRNNIINRKISLKCSYFKNHLVIDVSDNAGGIDEKIIGKIFTPYFTTKHQSQGAGMGLYMTKMLIEQQLAGKLELYKNSLKGATFRINVPAIKFKKYHK